MFVDSHCHLDFPELAAELPQLLDAMRDERGHARALHQRRAAGVARACMAIAHAHANLYATRRRASRLRRTRRSRPSTTLVAKARDAQGRRDRRDRPRLLPPRGRPRMAARALSHAHPRRARDAASRSSSTRAPPPRTRSRSCARSGADEVGGVMHCFTETWDVARGRARPRLPHLVLGHRHVQERGRR